MSSDPAQIRDRRLRIAFVVSGAALWVVAFGWMWWIWQQRQSQPQPQSRQLPAPNAPVFEPWELPDFELTDQNGNTVRKSDLLGKQWVASFIFTRCTLECPTISKRVGELRDATKDTGVRIVTITVDPNNDTPAVLKRHAKSLGADGNRWLFLTGKADDVYRLVNKGFKVTALQNSGERRRPGQEVTHSQRVLHIDETGRVIGSYQGTSEIEIERLRRKIIERAKKDG